MSQPAQFQGVQQYGMPTAPTYPFLPLEGYSTNPLSKLLADYLEGVTKCGRDLLYDIPIAAAAGGLAYTQHLWVKSAFPSLAPNGALVETMKYVAIYTVFHSALSYLVGIAKRSYGHSMSNFRHQTVLYLNPFIMIWLIAQALGYKITPLKGALYAVNALWVVKIITNALQSCVSSESSRFWRNEDT